MKKLCKKRKVKHKEVDEKKKSQKKENDRQQKCKKSSISSEIRKNPIPLFSRIQFKLILGFLLPVVSIIILGIVSYQRASEAIVGNYEEAVMQTVNAINRYIGQLTDTVQIRYVDYLVDDEITKYFRGFYDDDIDTKLSIKDDYITDMKSNVAIDGAISNIMIVSDEHESISSTKVTTGAYKTIMSGAQGEIIKDDMQGFHWCGNVSDVDKHFGTSSEEYGIRMYRKMQKSDAMLIVDIKKEYIVDTLNALEAGENGYVALVTSDGAEIRSSATKDIGRTIFTEQEFYKSALESGAESDCFYVEYEGETCLFIYSIIDNKDLAVCSLISESYILEQVSDIKYVTIIIVVLTSIVAVIIGLGMAYGMSKTIKYIIEKLNKVAKGDLTVEVDIKRKDEFKIFAQSISSTIEGVKQLVKGAREVSLELDKAVAHVDDSATVFMETTQHIKQAVEEINVGASRMDQDSDMCLAQMDNLSTQIKTVSYNASEIDKLVDDTHVSIDKGIELMNGVNDCAKSTTSITNDVITSVKLLEENSHSIGIIVRKINEIAEETTLLSLNASIEAARAGAAGKGFAVVANEISSLATQSLESAGQIEKIVGDILQMTSQVVSVAKQADAVVKVQEDAVRETSSAFSTMQKNIYKLVRTLTDITNDVESMEKSRGATLESVENISALSAETVACSLSVLETAEAQNNAISELEEAANALSEKSSLLLDVLEQFIV